MAGPVEDDEYEFVAPLFPSLPALFLLISKEQLRVTAPKLQPGEQYARRRLRRHRGTLGDVSN